MVVTMGLAAKSWGVEVARIEKAMVDLQDKRITTV
jgi:hypothetical protein